MGAQRGPSSVTGVLLAGDAGVGKTRLLTEARSRLAADGWRVVVGHCLDLGDTALPYLPFSEVLGQLAAELPDAVAAVAGHHPALARLQPGRRMLAAEGAETVGVERSDLFEAVHALLEEAALVAPPRARRRGHPLGRPLDPRPADLPAHPPLHRPGRRCVVSYRADDLHRRHPLRSQVAEWSRLPGVRTAHARAARRGRRTPADRRARARGARHRGDRRHRRPCRGQRLLRRGADQRRRRTRPLGARRPGRRAAGPARPARRRRPAGRPGGQRRRPQGLPRAARRRLGALGRAPPSTRGCGRRSR